MQFERDFIEFWYYYIIVKDVFFHSDVNKSSLFF